MTTLILGCDVSLARTGLAVLRCDIARPEQGTVLRTGVIETRARDTRQDRLTDIYDEVVAFMEHFRAEPITIAYIEKPGEWARGKQKSSQVTVEALAQARAAVMLALSWVSIPAEEVPTNIAKAAVAGPVSKKETVHEQLKKMGLYAGDDPDIGDAVMLAFAGATLEHKKVIMRPLRSNIARR